MNSTQRYYDLLEKSVFQYIDEDGPTGPGTKITSEVVKIFKSMCDDYTSRHIRNDALRCYVCLTKGVLYPRDRKRYTKAEWAVISERRNAQQRDDAHMIARWMD